MGEAVKRDPLFSIFENLAEDDETRWVYNAQRQLNKIACEIVKFRTDHEWSQKELANYLGVSQSMVAKYESGDYNFTIESLNKLASKIGLSVEICLSGFDTQQDLIVESKEDYEKFKDDLVDDLADSFARNLDSFLVSAGTLEDCNLKCSTRRIRDMCTYYKENGKIPSCTHDCNGCMFHEQEETEMDDEEFLRKERLVTRDR